MAVGKLLEAITIAQAIVEPTDDQKAALQAAVDQYMIRPPQGQTGISSLLSRIYSGGKNLPHFIQ